VALSPDGRTAVSASYDNTLRLWDVGTGKELRQLKGHSGDVAQLLQRPGAPAAPSPSLRGEDAY
jgi:WD40 repeat protein